MAADSYGLDVDNAGGIVKRSGLSSTGTKDARCPRFGGNITKLITEGFALGSAFVTSTAIFSAYYEASDWLHLRKARSR